MIKPTESIPYLHGAEPANSQPPEAPPLRTELFRAMGDRRDRKDRRRRDRRDRRDDRRDRRTARERRNVPAVLLAGAMLLVELIVAAESFGGLVGFARQIGIHGTAAYGVPVTLDGIAIIASLLALRAELARESSGLYRLTLFAFTAASSAANGWHGAKAGDLGTALYYGGMSLAVTWLFSLSLRQIRAGDRRAADMVTEPLPHFAGWHWARYPKRTFDAWSLAIRDGHKTARAALDAADAAELPAVELDPEVLNAMTARDRMAWAFGAIGAVDVPRALALLADRGAAVDQSHAYQVRRAMLPAAGRAGSES